MKMESENTHIKGIITNKIINEKGGPKGFFFIGEDKYTSWDSDDIELFNTGDNVAIDFKEKDNDVNGKVYHNKNIVKICLAGEYVKREVKTTDFKNPDVSGVICIGDDVYRVVELKLEKIPTPDFSKKNA
jgi:hypothetical protein